MLSDHASSADRGFTLIEVLIGMVLSAIVLTIIGAALVSAFGSSERSALKSKAQRATSKASEQLTSDLRAARAPQREPRYVGSPDNLRAVLLETKNPDGWLVEDIVHADSTSVIFYAELFNGQDGAECVTWQMTPQRALLRTVRAHSSDCVGAPGTTLQATEVMPPSERRIASEAAQVNDPFAYDMLVQASPLDPELDARNCSLQESQPAAGVDKPGTPVDEAAQSRNQIVGIRLDLRSFVHARGARGDQQLVSHVSLPARQSLEYRYAIGCVA